MNRISTLVLHERATQNILANEASLSRVQLQLSTGRRILSAADDPAGSARAMDIQRYLESNRQYLTNMTYVRQRLTNQESTLAQATDLLQRARELAIQGNNDTVSAESKAGLANEVDQLLAQLLSLANTTDTNGEYLFGGTRRQAAPFQDAGGGVYTYGGDQLRRQLQVSDDRLIADADAGHEIFMDVPTSAGGSQSIFRTVQDLADRLRSDADLSATIDDLRLTMDRILEIRARGGARLNAIDTQESLNADVSLELKTQLSGIEDLDYAEAVSRMNRQLAALQASQQTYARIQQLSLFNYL